MKRGYMPKAGRSDWRTPFEVVSILHQMWPTGVGLDPCACGTLKDRDEAIARINLVGPEHGGPDGLVEPWGGRGPAYVNPPFDALADWTAKCHNEWVLSGTESILLMPARTDTAYWHDHVSKARAICFWRGRMRFIGAPAACPFPVVFVYWGAEGTRFSFVFGNYGMVVRP